MCEDDNGAAVAGATAVDIFAKKKCEIIYRKDLRVFDRC